MCTYKPLSFTTRNREFEFILSIIIQFITVCIKIDAFICSKITS